MNSPVVWSVLLAAVFLTTGCNKDDDPSGPVTIVEGSLQIANAIVDSRLLTFRIKATSSDDWNELAELGFRQATQMGIAPAEDYDIEVTYFDPLAAEQTNLVPDFQFTMVVETIYTLILHGEFASPELLLLEKPSADFDTGDGAEIEVRVVHAGTVDVLDVYLGDPNATIGTTTPLVTLIPGEWTDPLRVASGLNRLRVTQAGDTQVVYDSETFNVVSRSLRTIVLHDNVGPDASTTSAFLLTENGTIEYPNEVARAGFRVLNAVSDEDSITVTIVDSASEESLDTVTLAYTEITAFSAIDAAFVDVSVAAASTPGVEAKRTTVSLNQGTFYTITIGGSIADDSLAVRSSTSPQRRIATSANLHFINTLRETDDANNPRIDVYVLDVGDALEDDFPILTQFGFLSSSAVTMPAKLMDVVVTTSGTNAILLGPIRIDLVARSSIIAVAAEAAGGGEPYQMIVETTQ